MTKASDFDDYTRSQIFARMAIKSRSCPRCGNFDSFVPLSDPVNDERTTEHDGRVFGVKQLRCVACGLSDLVERDAGRETHAQPEPLPGKPSMSDGRMFVAQQIDQSPDEEASDG